MSSFLDAFNVWSTTRAAGLTSYLLMFVSVTAGLMMSLKLAKGRTKSFLLALHESSGWFGFLFGLVHGGVLLFDKYVGYTLASLLVPFTATTHPIVTGLGTIAFYITLILILTSDGIKKIGIKSWRTIHFLAFPGFFLALLHGLLIGTDTQYLWAKLIYLSTAAIVIGLTAARVILTFRKKGKNIRTMIPQAAEHR
ncbi:ferric reductase-like transmembrane domain-containing protein [Paenibacillus macerans]|uniref:ferric reductase-like transmembrane domain-containing protein n=1 Tax=Paenibacillus macerans TaxID=44252 RepID=UPI00203FD631|nr:ferric reductase-like transmembrane domain-containing protein [Paenibacillus macerans]MCM3702787.1 ferric reductase-like transmembrane domain-containing protein [Paenibacillus macerans]